MKLEYNVELELSVEIKKWLEGVEPELAWNSNEAWKLELSMEFEESVELEESVQQKNG